MSEKKSFLPTVLKVSGWLLSRLGILLATIFAASAVASAIGSNTTFLMAPLIYSSLLAAMIAIGGFTLFYWARRKGF